ncbi:UreD urease accessory protein-domain-containing protein [Phaeosphaeriaceae sp. PMI808]|nr:UreD urease accessory protein-domain-containing protein [Phaeosphaeriaceae sp. PMI808]
MAFTSPFGPSTSQAGHGSIVLAILPPDKPVLQNVSYQYPLKLVAPDPLPPPSHASDLTSPPPLIHTIFLLTYGGGIVAGDTIDLDIRLESKTRLILLTQGSTKIFKTPDPSLLSRQHMTVHLDRDAALFYIPDPVQPFAQTAFHQSQKFYLKNGHGNLCACDWVTSGRSARGENWSMYAYNSRNEIWTRDDANTTRLLLRDNLILDEGGRTDMPLSARMDGYAVFGTLIIYGPVFASLARFFLDEFESLPRIGGRDWGDGGLAEDTGKERRRRARQQREKGDELIWSAANVRGFVLVKFGCREVEGAKVWLRDMIVEEESVVKGFGERAIMCLK